jgi:hypothetical protein
MTRSPDSPIPSVAGQPTAEKRDDKAFTSLTPPAIRPIQLELFPGRACVHKAKPATIRSTAGMNPNRRDGVSGGSTRRQNIKLTGEILPGPALEDPSGREAYKGGTRKRGAQAGQRVGGGRSTGEARDNPVEGRAATFIKRTKQGKAVRLSPQGKAPSRRKPTERKAPERLSQVRKLQRTLYRVAKLQPRRRFTLLYDKVCRQDIL